MEKVIFSFKKEVLGKLLRGIINKKEAARIFDCSPRTVRNYLLRLSQQGWDGLKDKRHSNYHKLTSKQQKDVVETKKSHPWRSARKTIEVLNLPSISSRQIQKIWVKHGVNQLNIERLKPIHRFVAPSPNNLWQADIMGKINFPFIGTCFLIANLDDHSRFILSGKWFSSQNKINVFRVWFYALYNWGLPEGMLQDRGSQYHPRNPKDQADYQFYAEVLGIKLIFANKAQTKGKMERFWRFVQQDFVRENLDVKSLDDLNQRFFKWIIHHNETFKSDGLGMSKRTPAEVYQPSERRKSPEELREILTITMRRYVYLDSTISLFGKRYRIPLGYIGCRIWVKILGDKLIFEAMDRIICKQNLRV
jgi:transposase InsO family protein